MAQTVTLTGHNFHRLGGEWTGSILLDADLVDGGGVAYLRRVARVSTSIRVETSSTAGGGSGSSGPELAADVETYAAAFVFDDGVQPALTLKGPAHADNAFTDPSEPYFWTPDNGADWGDWVDGATTDRVVRLTISGPPSLDSDVGISAASGAPSASLAPVHESTDSDAALSAASGAPSASLAPAEQAVDHHDAALSAASGSPSASLAPAEQVVNNRDLGISAASGAPSASLAPAEQVVNNRDLGISAASGAPSASLAPAEQVVNNRDLGISAASGAPSASLAPVHESTDSDAALSAASGAPSASLAPAEQAVDHHDAALSAASGSPSASLAPDQLANPALSAAVSSRSLAGDTHVFALELDHMALAQPVRIVADGTDDVETYLAPYEIEGHQYRCVAFQAAPPQDKEGEVRTALLQIDNVGRDLMEWVEATDGGRNVRMRLMEVSRPPAGATDATVVWDVTLPVNLSEATNQRLRVSLSQDPMFGRPAVKRRHDPVTSPGLF